ncbi:40533_t:CDS:2 [Gigaspora margarita]|uniref:40533_t:CDS:1 n=1 Tax=Gigaspora margarita TaxID=4874 RepID=A0ABN7W1J0_GIGMA|nr:40533_t:CDS:2 [Gigaspora margarita]
MICLSYLSMIAKKHYIYSQKNNNSSSSQESSKLSNEDALKTSNIELSTKTVTPNNLKSSKDSWVWSYMEKDVVNKQVACDIITVSLDGHEKKCDKVYSITTSTTHLSEHLNTIHRIFPSKKYEKNSEEQTIIRSDNLAQTIPSMLLKQSEDSFESACQVFNTESIPTTLDPSSNLSSTSTSISISNQSPISNIQKN